MSVTVIAIVFVFAKNRRRARQSTERASGVDLNPTYGDYVDPDPRVEVVDNNENYSPEYVIGTSRLTDNNPYYE